MTVALTHPLALGEDGAYRVRPKSVAFPDIASADINRFLPLFQTLDHTSARRHFAEWLRQK